MLLVGFVFIEAVAHVHDLVPLGEPDGVVAVALAHDGVESSFDEVCFVEQPLNARVVLPVGVFLVNPLHFVEDDVQPFVESRFVRFQEFCFVHPSALLACFGFQAKLGAFPSHLYEFRVKKSPEIAASKKAGRRVIGRD